VYPGNPDDVHFRGILDLMDDNVFVVGNTKAVGNIGGYPPQSVTAVVDIGTPLQQVKRNHRIKSLSSPTIDASEKVHDLMVNNTNGGIYDFAFSEMEMVGQNFAFVFVKPELSDSLPALNVISRHLDSRGASLIERGHFSGDDIRKLKFFDKQFFYIKRYAEDLQPNQIKLNSEEMRLFADHLPHDRTIVNGNTVSAADWIFYCECGEIMNPAGAAELLNVSFVVLSDLWDVACARGGHCELRRGLHIAWIDSCCTHDINIKRSLTKSICVINGFYHAMRTSYELKSVRVHYLAIKWNNALFSWKSFLNDVVGDAEPAKAGPLSLRGELYANWAELGLAERPSRRNNCIHVAQSAFEGFVERMSWLKEASMFTDPFGIRMAAAMIKPATVERWSKNVLVDDRSVFDHLVNLGADECLLKMLELLGGKKSRFHPFPILKSFIDIYCIVFTNVDLYCQLLTEKEAMLIYIKDIIDTSRVIYFQKD
jgi:hypothetical protein